jgi:hypothetical protein
MGARVKISMRGWQAGRGVRIRLPLCSSAARRGRLLAASRDPQSIALFPLRPGVFARRIGVVTAGRLQSGPMAANAGKSRF